MLQFSHDLEAQLSNTNSQSEFIDLLKREMQRKPRFGFNTHGNVIPVPSPGGRNVTIIAAMDAKGGIGKNNDIPWNISPDMQQFKRLTTNHFVLMGRRTFASLNYKPLPNRMNVVMTSDIKKLYEDSPGTDIVGMFDLEAAVDAADGQMFIIGGAQIYKQALELDLVCDMILTRINHDAQCDTFFPEFDKRAWLPPAYSTHDLSGGVTMRYEYWRRRFSETSS
jgi:dihydrofolate reductase